MVKPICLKLIGNPVIPVPVFAALILMYDRKLLSNIVDILLRDNDPSTSVRKCLYEIIITNYIRIFFK